MKNVNTTATTVAYAGTAVPAPSYQGSLMDLGNVMDLGSRKDLGGAAATCRTAGAEAASMAAKPAAPMAHTFVIPSRPWHAAPPRDLIRL